MSVCRYNKDMSAGMFQLSVKPDGSPYTFFVVDDMSYMVSSISASIEQMGGKVLGSSTDSVTALEMIRELSGKIDVITCDMNMPYMDGLELLKKVKEFNPNQKMVMISAHGMKDKITEARELGAEYYLLKPFSQKDLFDALNKISKT